MGGLRMVTAGLPCEKARQYAVRVTMFRRTFANLCGMPDENVDPSGNTAAFRAFANTPEPTVSEPSSKAPFLVGVGFAAVLVVALALWLALS